MSWKLSVKKNRKTLIAWELITVIIAMWYWFAIPIRISIKKTLFGDAYDYIDLISWIIYLIDIFVNLRTTYIGPNGVEITDTQFIAKNYLVSLRFIADLISIVGLPTLLIKNLSDD